MGVVGGDRRYHGPGVGQATAWRCPSCHAEQVGDPDGGCPSCGAGQAKAYKAQPAAPPLELPSFYDVAERWAETHAQASLAEAFVAGYQLALTLVEREAQAATTPLTFDPDGKTSRTIVAALKLFREQVLKDADEEIASGEWCSIGDVDVLIRQLEKP